MVTAYGCYISARQKAFRLRMIAVKAAERGKNKLAIRLTYLAQMNDQSAESWKKHVPEWQWKCGLEYDSANSRH